MINEKYLLLVNKLETVISAFQMDKMNQEDATFVDLIDLEISWAKFGVDLG